MDKRMALLDLLYCVTVVAILAAIPIIGEVLK